MQQNFPPTNGTSAPFLGSFETSLALQTPTAPLGPSREDVIAWVKQHEADTDYLRQRYDKDFDRYRLTEHVNKDPVTGVALQNYATYTSNAPRTYADKIISWITMAELILRAPHIEVGQHQAEQDNLKERFAIGCLRAADERLGRLLQPQLRGALGFFTVVRGGYVGGRCLLVKKPDGSTYVDITPFDPLHTFWEVGADGLEWVCHKIKKTRAQIRREYGVYADSDTATDRTKQGGSVDAEKEGIWVYDFYDKQINMALTQQQELKPATAHGSPRVPCYLQLVGPMPMLQSERTQNLVAEVGESVYAGLRDLYAKYNDVMSIMLELVSRARRQTVIIQSADGKATLKADPYVTGTEISLSAGDKIYTLEMQRLAQDTAAYIGLIAGEIQRGSLPYSAWGELQFQLSGFAITQLRQGIETLLSVRIDTLTQIYLQIANLLYDQFMTGAFEGVKLSGVDAGRTYFNQTITPQELQGTCDYTVRLVSQLPQDDMSKWATAKLASDGHFLSKIDIHDNILGTQDSQQAMDKVKEEMAEQGLPEAVLYSMGMAAQKRGETAYANMYLAEFQRLMDIKLGKRPPDQLGPGQPQPPGGGGGQRPQALPQAATGAAPSPAASNNGPSFVPPNTPRPGAQQGP